MNRSMRPVTAAFAAAILIVLYPFFANLYNTYVQSLAVVSYEESAADLQADQYAEMIAAAQAWNAELITSTDPGYFPEGLTQTEIYESLIALNEDGIMGYVSIPKIDVTLPIYHYATEEVLMKGAGHMEASSLPVGGESTHCVITAHRGLPTALMFTNLDQLCIGDVFYLKVLGQTLAYAVCEIREVEPSDTQSLMVAEGRDLCTLVTCTPYGVNSLRLLVTGERTEYNAESADAQSDGSDAPEAVRSYALNLAAAMLETAVYLAVRRRVLKKSKEEAIR